MNDFFQHVKTSFEKQLLNELDALYRTARYLVRDPHLAEDIVHDVIAKALEARHSVRHRENLRPWLFTILRNTITDHFRRQGRRYHYDSLETLETDQSHLADAFQVDEYVLSNVFDEHIEHALAALSEEMRMAVLLADVEGFSYQEIAEALGWPVGTVMSRLHRGRKKLRQNLTSYVRT